MTTLRETIVQAPDLKKKIDLIYTHGNPINTKFRNVVYRECKKYINREE